MNLLYDLLTSKSVSSNFIYNLLTPSDFPIDAKKIMASKNIRKGVKSKETANDITIHNGAILLTAESQAITEKVKRLFTQNLCVRIL